MKPDELRAIRKRLGWTLERLGQRVGVSKGMMSRYENGETRIPKAIAEIIRMEAIRQAA
jgi:transcriptional regulator with XRE-family HTH domain